MDYTYGDKVVFTDEFGKQRVGTVINTEAYGMRGVIAITGTYGAYARKPEEIRPALDYEVHKFELEGKLS